MKPFIGRKRELEQLEALIKRGSASLVVIKGRRRIGKSRLAEEFGNDKVFLSFSGLTPIDGVSAQDQRDHFAHQFAHQFQLPSLNFQDWNDAFFQLSSRLNTTPTVILFDEISWMGSKDPTFIPKLKAWWDTSLQKHPYLVLILCGSVSTWIDENIINSTALFGRISCYIELGELSFHDCHEFLQQEGVRWSHLDIFKLLSVTGGVPWYLEQIDLNETVDQNLMRLCFAKQGLLVHEFDRIFNDLFSQRGGIYNKIVQILSEGMRDAGEITVELKYPKSGTLGIYLKALETSGFVSSHPHWSFKTHKSGRKTLYRLSDNYVRFYLKYIEPNLSKIAQNAFVDTPLSSLPGWDTIVGFQIENLLLKNRSQIFKALRIHPQEVVADNPYLQSTTTRHKGVQIDYLIQTHSNTLYVCEIKVRKRELGLEVVEAMKEKIERLSVPTSFGVCPVLLYLGPVSDALLNSRYFFRMVDIADFLE